MAICDSSDYINSENIKFLAANPFLERVKIIHERTRGDLGQLHEN